MLEGLVSWTEYTEAMMMRFSAVEMRRPIAQLKRLREEANFFTYVDSFVPLVSPVNLSDEDQGAMFVEGLKGSNKKLIMVLNPMNLQHCELRRILIREEEGGMNKQTY